MAGELVFATGATGMIGFAVLVEALKAGYRVRAAIRRADQESELRSNYLIQPFNDKLEFVVVPDITLAGAFDNVLNDVTYIEHIASPLPSATVTDPYEDIIVPAIHGTTSILESAFKTKSIRRVVITSSAVAIVPLEVLMNGDDVNTYTSNSRVPAPEAPWGDGEVAYVKGKVLALQATEKFIADKKPHFTVVNVMPSYVLGANKLVTHSSKVGGGTNGLVMAVAMGMNMPTRRPGTVISLQDVARVHVASLDEQKIPGNKNFVFHTEQKMAFDDVNEIAKKNFREAVADGTIPLGGSIPTTYVNIDISEEVKLFGPLQTHEEMVVSVLDQYVTLKRKEEGNPN